MEGQPLVMQLAAAVLKCPVSGHVCIITMIFPYAVFAYGLTNIIMTIGWLVCLVFTKKELLIQLSSRH